MMAGESWPWVALFLLGTYHGINPGMGWLFAVALGMQEQSRRAVERSLLPIALGHGLAIGLVVALASLVQIVLPLVYIKASVAFILFCLGLYRLFRHRHPRGGGMRVGFRDLSIWSFLMASAHGAGFMVLPVVLGMSAGDSGASEHHRHMNPGAGPWTSLSATLVHTTGYLLVTGLVALLVYQKLGVAFLRKGWFNLDLLWAIALIATGCLTLII
jgi:hypothetical protein